MLQSVQAVLEALGARHLTLAVAEGDTGGLLLQALTAVPGSSAVVRGGVVAYHDDLKREVLGVPVELLQGHGAVSAEVAEAMARGVRTLAGARAPVAGRPRGQPRGQRRGRAAAHARAAQIGCGLEHVCYTERQEQTGGKYG